MLENKDIICISTSNWGLNWGSRQHIMSILSEKNRVLYIEYQASILHPLKYKFLRQNIKFSRLLKINERLFIYRPKINLPFGYYSNYINNINQKYLLVQLKQIMCRLNIQRPLLWIFAPCSFKIVGKLGEEISIYHCIDAFKHEKTISLRYKVIERMERKLRENCDIIFASSKNIFQEMSSSRSNVFYIPSAVDANFLKYKSNGNISFQVQHIPKPRIGFVGTVDSRLDVELIRYIAAKEPDWSFVFIGTIADKKVAAHLRKYNNIHFLGFKKKEELPFYIEQMDICTIPYKVNEFTRSISPVKIYEYLSLGKPTVSTQLPEVLSLSKDNLIKIAEDKEKFLEDIHRYLHEKEGHEFYTRRRIFASSNTWQNRVEAMSEIIYNFLKK